jgi:hypothetical protein
MNRDQFFDKIAGMDEADLKKALWTLYWRGAAPVRERIEAAIDPQATEVIKRATKAPPDPELVLSDVMEFVSLVRSGSYLAGDRRVSRHERSRWRHTFRRLAGEALEALSGEDVESAATAVAAMIDLACEMRDVEYVRSEDPVEAARFVVSDAAAVLWSRMRQEYGFAGFAERASVQLLKWESRYGWTRRGDGWVSGRETSLGRVLSELIPVPDLWAEFADHYLDALDRLADGGRDKRGGPERGRQQRAKDLSEWHALLVERLAGSDYEEHLDRLVVHGALAGPERTFLQARLARARGEDETAVSLVQQCLTLLPGHREFHRFAGEIGAPLPPHAQQVAARQLM